MPANLERRPIVRSYSPLRKCSFALQEELMATTRTPGITILSDGRRFIDKRYLGVRIGLRVGAMPKSKLRTDSTSQSLEAAENDQIECANCTQNIVVRY